MKLINIFKHCMILPKKEAVFLLNRVSMRDTLVYIFILIFLLGMPEGIELVFADNQFLKSDLRSVFILQMITLYPMYVIFSSLIGISLLAAGGLLVTILFKRKLTYHHLWKMSAYALTTPLLLSTITSLIGISHWSINIVLLVVFYFITYKMIIIYPKRLR